MDNDAESFGDNCWWWQGVNGLAIRVMDEERWLDGRRNGLMRIVFALVNIGDGIMVMKMPTTFKLCC